MHPEVMAPYEYIFVWDEDLRLSISIQFIILCATAIGLAANKYSNKHTHEEGEVWRPGFESGIPYKISSQPNR